MIIRSEEESVVQIIILSAITILFLILTKSINHPLTFFVAFIGAFVLFVIVSRLFRHLQGKYFGEIIASITEASIEIQNKKMKWQQITKWNVTTKSVWGLSVFHLILNGLTGYYSRTFYISTESRKMIVRNAPKRLRRCFEEYAPEAYDEKFVINEPKNKVI